MARKPTTPAPVERSPALSAIEQLSRLIQTGTPAARVTRAAQGIASRWRATAGAPLHLIARRAVHHCAPVYLADPSGRCQPLPERSVLITNSELQY